MLELEGLGYFVLTATQTKQQISAPGVSLSAFTATLVFLYHSLGSAAPKPWKKSPPPPFLSDLKSLELQSKSSPVCYWLLNEIQERTVIQAAKVYLQKLGNARLNM